MASKFLLVIHTQATLHHDILLLNEGCFHTFLWECGSPGAAPVISPIILPPSEDCAGDTMNQFNCSQKEIGTGKWKCCRK